MIRNNSIFLSEETTWMLHAVRRSTCDDKGTVDMLADSFLRELLTTRYPGLVELYEKYQQAKQDAAKAYQAIEAMAGKAVSPQARVGENVSLSDQGSAQ